MSPRSVRRLALVILPIVAAVGCGEEGETAPAGPYTLTFAGDASFHDPHGGQTISVTLVGVSSGEDETQTGTVSDGDPAFRFRFPDALVEGQVYRVHYWIDSNFGGGTEGVCDAKGTDHQWAENVGTASRDVDLTVSHDPAATENVCETAGFDLTFNGDASFQGPHGMQPVTLALVRSEDGAVLFTADDTISASENPSFSFTARSALLPDFSYAVHLWIDSNFGEGEEGVCDPPVIDHQWAIELGAVTQDTVVTYGHNAEATTDVCDTFD